MKTIIHVIALSILVLSVAGCTRYYSGGKTDHFDGERFFNPGRPMTKDFVDLLKWRFTSVRQFWPEFSDLATYDLPPDRVAGNALRVSYVGHATVLIQTQGLNILIDPMWSDRASPVSWAGPRRVHPPGIALHNLPPIDVVLISHNHYDHLDLSTIERLWARFKPRIIVPLGNDSILTQHTPDMHVEAYDWGAQVAIQPGTAIHLEPMHHWSARGIFDRNKALWAAFTITTPGGNIYVVGDSGYGEGEYFRLAKEKFQQFRLAILPIGDYDPSWFMGYGHMSPEECVKTFLDLGKPAVLPIHYRTFPLADSGYDEPLARLRQAMIAEPATKGRFMPLMAGEYWNVPE